MTLTRPITKGERVSGQVDPSHIMQVGMGFFGSKTLLSAVELELFTKLGSEGMTGAADRRDAQSRTLARFRTSPMPSLPLACLIGTVTGPTRTTAIHEAGAVFLDKASPAYIGGFLEMANARLYGFWGDLTEALRTGEPQNEVKHTGRACSRSSTATRPGSSSS